MEDERFELQNVAIPLKWQLPAPKCCKLQGRRKGQQIQKNTETENNNSQNNPDPLYNMILYYIYTYIYILYMYYIKHMLIHTYITLHYITLHTSVRTYVHTYIHRYVTLRYVTLRYITYIHIYIWYSYSDVYTTYDIYIDTQCIHIYSVHNWNQLGAAPAGCAWWLWHCSVDSGPCKRLNSQCHGSILISEEKYISSIKLWTAEILSSAETFSEFLNALRSKFTTGSTHSLKFHHRKLRHRKFRHRKRAYSRPGLKIHWFLHWIAPFMFLFLPLYFSLLFCDLYKKNNGAGRFTSLV